AALLALLRRRLWLAHLGPLLGLAVLERQHRRAGGDQVRGQRRGDHASRSQARRRPARLRRPRRSGQSRPADRAADAVEALTQPTIYAVVIAGPVPATCCSAGKTLNLCSWVAGTEAGHD